MHSYSHHVYFCYLNGVRCLLFPSAMHEERTRTKLTAATPIKEAAALGTADTRIKTEDKIIYCGERCCQTLTPLQNTQRYKFSNVDNSLFRKYSDKIKGRGKSNNHLIRQTKVLDVVNENL